MTSCTSKYIKNNDKVLLQKETEHFIMQYSKSDENLRDDILTNLENNYEQLAQNLQIEPKNKFTIKLYPILSALQKYCDNVQGQSPDISAFIDVMSHLP